MKNPNSAESAIMNGQSAQVSEPSGTVSNVVDSKSPEISKFYGGTPASAAVDGGATLSTEVESFSEKVEKSLPDTIREGLSRVPKTRGMKGEMLKYYRSLCDIVILTMLTVLSACMPNVRFMYRRSWLYSPLFLLVVALAGAGKSIMDSIFHILDPIQKLFLDEYESDKRRYDEQQRRNRKGKKQGGDENEDDLMEKPVHKFFRIPVDCTYASFLKALMRNLGMGALLDTEIDTIVQAFKSDMCDYSVLLRKAFKHESHSVFRKTDDEYYNIPCPQFAVAMSGTFDQVQKLVTATSNGLFSRFLYYFLTNKIEWINADVDDNVEEDDNTFFTHIGERVLILYQKLMALPAPVTFRLKENQMNKLNEAFSTIHFNMTSIEGADMHSVVVRMAIVLQRIAMVLTMIRVMEKTPDEIDNILKKDIICSDKDFNTAMTIVKALLQHSRVYFEYLNNIDADANESKEETEAVNLGREDLNEVYNLIPEGKELNRQQLLDYFLNKGIPMSTAGKHITKWCQNFVLRKVKHNVYIKVSADEFLLSNKRAKNSKRKKKQA